MAARKWRFRLAVTGADFGLAKLLESGTDLTTSIGVLGTPHYLAPEIAARDARSATIASDVYSLGAILYELLAGRPPFVADGIPMLLRQITDTEPAPPSRWFNLRLTPST